MPSPLSPLLTRGRLALGLTQRFLADLVGSSERTVQRWETRGAMPAPWHIQRLADAVRPHDEALARELDVWAPRPRPAPEATAPIDVPTSLVSRSLPAAVLVDAVVCVAAEAMAVAPQALRPALLAAFSRARDVGLTPDAVIAVLSQRDLESAGDPREGTHTD